MICSAKLSPASPLLTGYIHYTGTFGELFIELVQRKDAYQDYGPGNAAVRLAAQDLHEQQHRLF